MREAVKIGFDTNLSNDDESSTALPGSSNHVTPL
jgi:hypothetical protein